ncbi:hypothetical protein QP414_10330 [Corynebacterium simulans]|uniref:hypothetical protein n=1 Tax=Corynebacterium TaxID=1716 RepID=UPI00254D3A7C|nr:hypothetical protein [Corynebacterium simulans]MDK7139695.1 hypothetical protein [Corynebacterium simulans]
MNTKQTTYIIDVIGCDDYTTIPFTCTPGELPTLVSLAKEINKEGGGCKPIFHVYKALPADEDDCEVFEDAAGNRWTQGGYIA